MAANRCLQPFFSCEISKQFAGHFCNFILSEHRPVNRLNSIGKFWLCWPYSITAFVSRCSYLIGQLERSHETELRYSQVSVWGCGYWESKDSDISASRFDKLAGMKRHQFFVHSNLDKMFSQSCVLLLQQILTGEWPPWSAESGSCESYICTCIIMHNIMMLT